MAITTMAQVTAKLPGQRYSFVKNASTTPGGWSSLWRLTGLPAQAAIPSSGLAGDIPTRATVGAFPIINAAGGSDLYLARISGANGLGNSTAEVILYDRLWHNSGISATAVTSQTINSVALTRPDALGGQVEAWWTVYATMGAGTPTVTIGYTNQDGTAGRTGTSGVLATTMATERSGPFQLQSGDTGVRSIQTWQADATFSSGTIGLVLRRRLASINLGVTQDSVQTPLECALARIPTDACLELVTMASTSSSMPTIGELNIIEG
jgi:hypothetical protein